MNIQWVGMTRRHYETGDSKRIRMVVLHATAGSAPGDYTWLRNGGNEQRPVSIHYYINKAGTISQMVKDADIAWHCGKSQWQVDGKAISNCNRVALGIELENWNNGKDPYPQQQYDAALWLVRQLVRTYNVPRHQLVRHLDISPGRKTDPAGFPWERFVADVYADQPGETLPIVVQMRDLLLDLAYRAAGGGSPARWSLRREAELRGGGMPVHIISRGDHGELPHGEGQDDLIRPVVINGKQFVLEAYARDLFYAPPDRLNEVSRLSTTAPGALRNALLDALFRTVDPQKGFQPNWAFHSFYLKQMNALGVPISANARLEQTTSDNQNYVCQHFSLDSICSPVGHWDTIFRLSDLRAAPARGDAAKLSETVRNELVAIILNDLYTQRTNHLYNAQGLFCYYADDQHLGAPIGPPDYEISDGMRFVMMPFALDTIFCRMPNEAETSTKHELSNDPQLVGRLSGLMAGDPTLPTIAFGGALVGTPQPLRQAAHGIRVNRTLGSIDDRPATSAELLLIYPAAGPAEDDIQAAMLNTTPPWNYYLDRNGRVTQLRDESGVALPMTAGRRALAVAIEGCNAPLQPQQSRALADLLQGIMTRHRLTPNQLRRVQFAEKRGA